MTDNPQALDSDLLGSLDIVGAVVAKLIASGERFSLGAHPMQKVFLGKLEIRLVADAAAVESVKSAKSQPQ